LESLPFPARDLTSHLRHRYYNYLFFKPVPVALIRGSLGCLFRCNFCAVSSMLDGKLYRHSVQRTVEELTSIAESHVLWVDDEFLLDAPQATLLAWEIEKAGIRKTHTILSRSDTIVKNPGCIEE
jgi:hopanoid C-3 methylase